MAMSKRYEGGLTVNVAAGPSPSNTAGSASRLKTSAISGCGHVHADDPRRARARMRTGGQLGQAGHGVHHRAGLAAPDLQDQLRCALDPRDVVVEVHAALETMRRVAGEVVAAGPPGDRIRKEERRLHKHVAGILARLWPSPRP